MVGINSLTSVYHVKFLRERTLCGKHILKIYSFIAKKYQNLELESLAYLSLRLTSHYLQLSNMLASLIILKSDEILKYMMSS